MKVISDCTKVLFYKDTTVLFLDLTDHILYFKQKLQRGNSFFPSEKGSLTQTL